MDKQESEQSQKNNRTIKQSAVSPCDGGLEPATTKLESVTAPAAPHSSGMGKRRKWLSMSMTEGKRRCCTRHWPHSVRERRRCCRDREMEAWGYKNMERERLSHSRRACFPLILWNNFNTRQDLRISLHRLLWSVSLNPTSNKPWTKQGSSNQTLGEVPLLSPGS